MIFKHFNDMADISSQNIDINMFSRSVNFCSEKINNLTFCAILPRIQKVSNQYSFYIVDSTKAMNAGRRYFLSKD